MEFWFYRKYNLITEPLFRWESGLGEGGLVDVKSNVRIPIN